MLGHLWHMHADDHVIEPHHASAIYVESGLKIMC